MSAAIPSTQQTQNSCGCLSFNSSLSTALAAISAIAIGAFAYLSYTGTPIAAAISMNPALIGLGIVGAVALYFFGAFDSCCKTNVENTVNTNPLTLEEKLSIAKEKCKEADLALFKDDPYFNTYKNREDAPPPHLVCYTYSDEHATKRNNQVMAYEEYAILLKNNGCLLQEEENVLRRVDNANESFRIAKQNYLSRNQQNVTESFQLELNYYNACVEYFSARMASKFLNNNNNHNNNND